MKTIRHYLMAGVVLLVTASVTLVLTGCAKSDSSAEAKTLYTCGMHPQVIQDHPGNCPICGMKLTPVRKQAGATTGGEGGSGAIKYYKSTMIPGEVSDTPRKDSMGMDMVPVYEDEAAMDATISIDPVTIQNMALRTTLLTNGPLRRVIRTVGTIEYDEAALADVTTKFKGWVEKLYVNTTGAQVHRNDPLFEVYSPELYSAQIEYLIALESGARTGGEAIRETARTKLKFWDISDAQIAELEKTREARKTLQVLAPIDGFVVEKMIVEGQMVEPGMKLYQLADLALVWVQAQIYEQDLPFIRLGQEAVVSLTYLPDRKFRGRVTYIYPNLNPKTRTVQVRMEFHNPGYFLKPGMFASVELTSELERSVLLLPDMAVLRSGTKDVVFVAVESGKFEPRIVKLGARAEDDMIQVLSGLEAGERVVTSGQFLLDSESQLREAIQKMLHPAQLGASPTESPDAVVKTAVSGDTNGVSPGKTVFLCPMPEHVAIQYDHPGKCPLCGMTLVPVSEATLERIQPGATIEYYACPMTEDCPTPSHGNEKYQKPGRCPVCGMTLVPVMRRLPEPEPESAKTEAPLPKLYTCPMASHAHVVTDKPGICPECEMTLVPTDTVKHKKLAEDNWRKQHPPALLHQH